MSETKNISCVINKTFSIKIKLVIIKLNIYIIHHCLLIQKQNYYFYAKSKIEIEIKDADFYKKNIIQIQILMIYA